MTFENAEVELFWDNGSTERKFACIGCLAHLRKKGVVPRCLKPQQHIDTDPILGRVVGSPRYVGVAEAIWPTVNEVRRKTR